MARVDMNRKSLSHDLAFSLSIREALEQWLGMRRGMRGAMEPCKRLCLPRTKARECSGFTKTLPTVQFSTRGRLKDRDAYFLLPALYLAGRAHLQPQHQAVVKGMSHSV